MVSVSQNQLDETACIGNEVEKEIFRCFKRVILADTMHAEGIQHPAFVTCDCLLNLGNTRFVCFYYANDVVEYLTYYIISLFISINLITR